MSKKRKISECINVRINVGNFQHIEITKYAEEEIFYENDQERVEKEDELTNDLVVSIVRSMKSIPEKLGKGVSNAQDVEDAIVKAIPEWMDKKETPNIATTSNKAEKRHNEVQAEQKDNKDNAISKEKLDILDVDEDDVVGEPRQEEGIMSDDHEIIEHEVQADLFEEDEPPAKQDIIEEITSDEVKTSPSETTSVVEDKKKETETVVDTFDFFDEDDDLFDE